MAARFDNLLERVRLGGVGSAAPVDLIAIGFSRRAEDAQESESEAREILKRYRNIARVGSMSVAEVRQIGCFDEYEALRCACLMELGRRAAKADRGKREMVDAPEQLFELLDYLRYEKQEHFVVFALDAKCQVITRETVHIGTLDMSLVGPREVFRFAVREGASCIAVAHNHPSGDPTPSPEDIEVTRKLKQIGESLDIPLVDHVIIGDPDVISFARRGLL